MVQGVLHYNSTYDEWEHTLREALTNANLGD